MTTSSPPTIAATAIHHSHADALGIENFAVKGMQGRGVLVDLADVFGMDFRNVGYDDLMHAMDTHRVEVEPGDVLLLRTGFAEVVLSMQREPDEAVLHHSCAALNRRDARLLNWITDSGIAALIADNYAVERYPALPPPDAGEDASGCCRSTTVLFKLGLPLGELWYPQGPARTGCARTAARASCSRRRRCGCRARWARR